MDLKPFRLDIDDLINEFAKGEMTTLTDMKKIWLSKKFSCIFQAKPNSKLGFFMQSLYSHSIGYMVSNSSISHRIGGLYCLFCLHETQPFKPPFRIYLCAREIKRLKELVVDAKKENIEIVSILVKNMLERDLFLYGATDLKQGSVEERVNELTNLQDARVQHANKKLFKDTEIERYINMDMDKEFDVDSLKKMSRDYYSAKELAIKEAEKVVDTRDIKHIAENQILIGDVIGKTSEDWNVEKEMFYKKTGHVAEIQSKEQQNGNGEDFEAIEFNENSGEEDFHFPQPQRAEKKLLIKKRNQMATFELYRRSTIGMCLTETLDEMVSSGILGPELAIQVLVQFDKSMAEALDNQVKTKVSIKGHLHTYRFCDNVWTFILQDALFKYDECQENVGRVKIVACDSKLLVQ
ncbi:unnamed protein product [Lactuca saligna]|uniref:Transcription initiation factor IIA subunit 2 n=1 Tax=Lactuca saligna TaxID=75948 RepID=A0AA35ZJP2_LACSI|nr:unnamed protein product [Lactuca saligna]